MSAAAAVVVMAVLVSAAAAVVVMIMPRAVPVLRAAGLMVVMLVLMMLVLTMLMLTMLMLMMLVFVVLMVMRMAAAFVVLMLMLVFVMLVLAHGNLQNTMVAQIFNYRSKKRMRFYSRPAPWLPCAKGAVVKGDRGIVSGAFEAAMRFYSRK